jgi:Uma2 family endonuclease
LKFFLRVPGGKTRKTRKTNTNAAGVKEYWMIDPVDKSTEGFQLAAGEFQLIPSEAGQIPFRLFDYTLLF